MARRRTIRQRRIELTPPRYSGRRPGGGRCSSTLERLFTTCNTVTIHGTSQTRESLARVILICHCNVITNGCPSLIRISIETPQSNALKINSLSFTVENNIDVQHCTRILICYYIVANQCTNNIPDTQSQTHT